MLPGTEKTVFSNFLEKVPRRGSRDMASRERIYKAYRMSHHASKSIEAREKNRVSKDAALAASQQISPLRGGEIQKVSCLLSAEGL